MSHQLIYNFDEYDDKCKFIEILLCNSLLQILRRQTKSVRFLLT